MILFLDKLARKKQTPLQQSQAKHAIGVYYSGITPENDGKELTWQWCFPTRELTYGPDSNEYRRYHLHDIHVQKAVRKARAGFI